MQASKTGRKSWLKKHLSRRATKRRTRILQFDPLERRDLMIATPAKFDFGTATYLESGFTSVTATTTYSVGLEYGWDATTGMSNVSGGTATDGSLRRDAVGGGVPRTFKVDVANGTYDVTVMLGNNTTDNQISLEGVVVDTNIDVPAQRFYTNTFPVTVSDGQLNLLIEDVGTGTDTWRIHGLTIQAPATPAAAIDSLKIDFGGSSTPAMTGYNQLVRFGFYEPSIGYGWDRISPTSEGDLTGVDDLRRDRHTSTGVGTFVADVINGTYDVTVTFGVNGGSVINTDLFLEGVAVDTFDCKANQFFTKTYRTTVSDGQLTLGIDGSRWSINGLEFVPASSYPSTRLTSGAYDFGPASGFPTNVETGYSGHDRFLDARCARKLRCNMDANSLGLARNT